LQSGILTVESRIQTSEESEILILGQFLWNPESTTDLESGIQVVQSGIQVVESGIQVVESGIQVVESGIQVVQSGIQRAESGIQREESGIQGEESGIQGVHGSHYIRGKTRHERCHHCECFCITSDQSIFQ
jgi:uncharacterized phage infection (PIP) family protein YhgE